MKQDQLNTARQLLTPAWQTLSQLQPLTFAALDELTQANAIQCQYTPVLNQDGRTRGTRHQYRTNGEQLQRVEIQPETHQLYTPGEQPRQ